MKQTIGILIKFVLATIVFTILYNITSPLFNSWIAVIISIAVGTIIIISNHFNDIVNRLTTIINSKFEPEIKKEIEVDPIAVLEKDYQFHLEERDKIEKIKSNVTVARKKVQQQVRELHSSLNKNSFFAVEKQMQNDGSFAEAVASKVANDKEMLDTLKPDLEELMKNEELLTNYLINYNSTITRFRNTIDFEKERFKHRQEMAQIKRETNSYLVSDSISDDSVHKQAMQDLQRKSQVFASQIEDFRNKNKVLLETSKFENTYQVQKGLDIIKNFNKELVQAQVRR